MAKNVGRLAGLAALGAAAYMMSKGKDKESPKGKEDTGPGYKSTETKETPIRKIEDYQAKAPLTDEQKYPSGVMGGARLADNKSNVTNRSLSTKDDDDKKADKADADNTTANAYKSGVMGGSSASDVPLYKQPDVTIGGQEKRTEGNKPMPSLKKVEAKAASNKTDAMRNASRAQQAAVNRMKAMKANPEAQAVEGVYPEQYLTPGAKVVSAAAKNLANRGSQKLAGDAAEGVLSPAGQRLKDVAQLREKMFPGRDATVTNPNAWAAGPKGMEKIRQAESRAAAAEARAAAAEAKRNAKDPLMSFKPGSDFKRGGAVKKMASGGMTASKRADGIASRGKTRCKMY